MTLTPMTPSGRFLGRKKDKPDPRDHLYAQRHEAEIAQPIKPSADLRPGLPAAFDQGNFGSCGPNAGDGLMCHLFPDCGKTGGFSRFQLYRDVRVIEGDLDEDGGVETRDVLRSLQLTGVAPESLWPYVPGNFKREPPPEVYAEAEKYSLERYSRLVSGRDMLACLSAGFPFLLGIELFESFDSDDMARHGVVGMPNPSSEQVIGGHDVLAVGYDLNFKARDDFKRSGVDPALVADQALLIRNSWGPLWGIGGHFWLPMPYAINTSLGGDAWTGRLT